MPRNSSRRSRIPLQAHDLHNLSLIAPLCPSSGGKRTKVLAFRVKSETVMVEFVLKGLVLPEWRNYVARQSRSAPPGPRANSNLREYSRDRVLYRCRTGW